MSTQSDLDWTATDGRAVDLIWVLAVDAVQKAGSGHPGTATSVAPTGYVLYQRLLRHDPAIGVDHFGASAGYQHIYQEFGITAERIAAAARDSLARVRA